MQGENAKTSKSNGGDTISVQASERALLAYLLARWHALDADFIIGHNIGPWDLTILLQRLQHHKVPHFSRVGRLKRQRVPNLSGGGGMYGGGASHVRITSQPATNTSQAVSAPPRFPCTFQLAAFAPVGLTPGTVHVDPCYGFQVTGHVLCLC